MPEADALTFSQPLWLLLLPLCWWLIAKIGPARGHSDWPRAMDEHLFQHLCGDAPGARYPLSLAVLVSLLLVAMAGPGWYRERQPASESSAARVIALSLSQTMMVQDLSPNRFEHARRAARDLLQSDFDGETGLVVFAGAAFTVAPLTRDSGTLARFLSVVDPTTMPVDGRRLDLAIERSQALLQSSVTGAGHIVAITDGADSADAVFRAIESIAADGSRLSIIPLGTEYGGPLPDRDGGLLRDASGRAQVVGTDLAQLAAFARAGGGHYQDPAAGADALHDGRAGAATVTGHSTQRLVDGGFWLVLAALPLLLWQFRRQATALTLLLALGAAGDAPALELDSLWHNKEQRAHRAFVRGDFNRAIELSNDPLLIGTAHLQLGHYDTAAQVLDALRQSVTAQYNRAHALVASRQFDRALEGFRQVLRMAPDHADARANLQRLEDWLAAQPAATEAGDGDDEDAQAAAQQDGDESALSSRSARQGSGSDSDADQPGAGAGLGQGRIDAQDVSDDLAADLQRLLARLESQGRESDREWLMQFSGRLANADPAQLFRRKFLRDHLRDSERPR